MPGITEMVAQVREQQEFVAAAAAIKAAREEIRGAAVDVRLAAEEFDMREFKLRQAYEKLDKAITSETQRRGLWQLITIAVGGGIIAAMLVTVIPPAVRFLMSLL